MCNCTYIWQEFAHVGAFSFCISAYVLCVPRRADTYACIHIIPHGPSWCTMVEVIARAFVLEKFPREVRDPKLFVKVHDFIVVCVGRAQRRRLAKTASAAFSCTLHARAERTRRQTPRVASPEQAEACKMS